MQLKILTVFLLWGQFVFSQTFVEVPRAPSFDGVVQSSIAFSDIDGDGDEDVLITGDNDSGDRIAKLYTNDGLGYFTEMIDTPFDGVRRSSIAFSDVNGDGNEDVLITGINNSNDRIAKLYINEGMGNFSEMLDTPFDGVLEGSIAFSDVDSDNDQDVVITGLNNLSEKISKLYTNDGVGGYTEVLDTPFEAVFQSSIAFSDIDDDGDEDILITGGNSSNENISKLYINDGLGNFTEVQNTPFKEVTAGSIAFSDVDGDGDEDVLIIGVTNSGETIAKLYLNDGLGIFTEVSDTPFYGVTASATTFSDVDGDGDPDVLITGRINTVELSSKLYTNNGFGNFTEVLDTPFDQLWLGSNAFSDIDGDGDQDVLITGGNSSNEKTSKLYINDGLGDFTEPMGTPFDGVRSSVVAFSDVDSDGDQDVLITGETISDGPASNLYINDGLGRFTKKVNTPFISVRSGSIAFSDVDNDSDPDVLITGRTHSDEMISKLYTNDGLGNFTEVEDTPFEGVLGSSIAFSDVDGDEDEDVLITGRNMLGDRISNLYINDGDGNYEEETDTPFDGVWYSSIAFADIDSDGDADVLITGETNSYEPISKLYINDGIGGFTEVYDTPFEGVWTGSVAFTDIDGDNDLDVMITGGINSVVRISKLYINDGLGSFTEKPNTPFEGVWAGSVAFIDIDGDSDPDILITGQTDSNEPITKLYINDGLGDFTEVYDTPFDGVFLSAIAFADIDGDGDSDVLITGATNPFEYISKLYANNGLVSSTYKRPSELYLEFLLFPNPAKDYLMVNFQTNMNHLMTVRVFDLKGQMIRQHQVHTLVGQQTLSIDISNLVSGSYFIQLDDGKRKGVRKFLVH